MANAKRRPMRLASARNSTSIANRQRRSVGHFETSVNGSAELYRFACQDACPKLMEAKGLSITHKCSDPLTCNDCRFATCWTVQ